MDEQYNLQPFPMVADATVEDEYYQNKEQGLRVRQFEQRVESIEEAEWLDTANGVSLGKKADAALATWRETWLAKGIDYYKHDNGWLENEDSAFTSGWTDEAITETLIANDLPIDYYQRLKGAKNEEHKKALLTWSKEEVARNKFISNTLNSYGGMLNERTVSSLITGLADIDLPIATTFGLAAKLTKARKIMAGSAMATHFGAAAIVHETSDGDISASEAALFSLIGATFDGYTVNRLGRNNVIKDDLAETVVDAPSNGKVEQFGTAKTFSDRFEEFKVKSNEIDELETNLKTSEAELKAKVKANEKLKKEKSPDHPDAHKTDVEIGVEKKRLEKRKEEIKQKRIALEKENMGRNKVDSGFKEFNKKVDEFVSKIDSDKKVQVAKRLREYQGDLALIADDIKTNWSDWKTTINNGIKNGDTAIIKDIDDIVNRLSDEGLITKSEFNNFKNSLNKGEFKAPKITVKMEADGTATITRKGKGRKNKLVVSGLVATAFAGEAMADDGTISTGGIGALLIGAVLFGMGLKNYKNIAQTMSDIKLLDRTRPLRVKTDKLLTSLRTSLTETTTPLSKDGNAEFVDFMKKVLWDSENGDALTVERNKNAIYHSYSARMHQGLDQAYHDFLKDNNISRVSAGLSNLAHGEINARMRFEIQVMEYIEQGKHADQPSIKRAADILDKLKKEFRQEMIDSGMKGADKMADLGSSWMPRYVRNEWLTVMLNSLDPKNKKIFIREFARMMDNNLNKAEKYLDLVTQHGDTFKRLTNIEEIKKFLESNKITSFTADELADTLGITSSSSGRTKSRKKINKAHFQSFKVKDTEGLTHQITLNDMFVNNATEALDRYFNSQSGHIAFADAGFKSIDEAREIAKNARQPKNTKVMNEVIDTLIGEPILDLNSDSAKILQALSNMTIATKMPLSVISLMQETFNTIIKGQGGLSKTALQEFGNIFKKHGESSAIVKELTEFMGQGLHKHSASYGAYTHVGEGIDNMVEGRNIGSNVLSKSSEIARDTVLYNLGLVPVSDFLTKINLVDSAGYLHDIVHGTKTMPQYLKKAIGLTDDIEAMLKTKLTKKDGTLQDLKLNTWSREEQLVFRKLIDNMMQKRIQQTTLGGTPAWGRSSMFGVVATQLLKFPIQAFSNHGIFDLKGVLIHKDPRAMGAMMAWFAGGYVAAYLRSAIQGKEVDDDELIMRAMLSMPIVGGIEGVYKSLTDAPAMFGALGGLNQNMHDVIDVMSE